MAGLPQSHISRLEKGQHVPSGSTLRKIATALGLSLKDFEVSEVEKVAFLVLFDPNTGEVESIRVSAPEAEILVKK